MAGRDSGWYRKTYEDISGELTVLAATDDTTLVTVKNSKYTIFIQEIHFFVTTDAAQSMSFEDSAGTPFVLRDIPASPGDSSEWHFYMSDEGHPLTEGKDFKMMVSAAGLAGALKWVGYQKLTAVGAP